MITAQLIYNQQSHSQSGILGRVELLHLCLRKVYTRKQRLLHIIIQP